MHRLVLDDRRCRQRDVSIFGLAHVDILQRAVKVAAAFHGDANAASVVDFLDLSTPAMLEPPAVVEPPVPTEATTGT